MSTQSGFGPYISKERIYYINSYTCASIDWVNDLGSSTVRTEDVRCGGLGLPGNF